MSFFSLNKAGKQQAEPQRGSVAPFRQQIQGSERQPLHTRRKEIQSSDAKPRSPVQVPSRDAGFGGNSQPLRPEEFYVQRFRELKSEIEMWIAKNAKSNGSLELSDTLRTEILERLSELGECGAESSTFLNLNPEEFRSYYRNPRHRIQLVRSIVAAFLFDQVFEPFAVGLPPEVSKALTWIEKDIISSEPQFIRILMIHQSLGRSTLKYLRSHTQEPEYQIKERLISILQLFLPKTPYQDVDKGAAKFVNKAIALKRDVTEEQALYQFCWINSGEKFNWESMEMAANEGKGLVALCTFPGLARTIKNHDVQDVVQVVKATILSENLLDL